MVWVPKWELNMAECAVGTFGRRNLPEILYKPLGSMLKAYVQPTHPRFNPFFIFSLSSRFSKSSSTPVLHSAILSPHQQ